MKVLGINAAFDSSAALFMDGAIRFAVTEERISRIKHHPFRFSSCVPHLLELASLRHEDLDAVVICRHGLHEALDDASNQALLDALRASAKSFEIVDSHHYLHACSAFFASGYPSSAILVMDGLGTDARRVRPLYAAVEENPGIFEQGWPGGIHESTSIWLGRGRSLTPVRVRYATPQAPGDISIGHLYGHAARHIFESRYDAGKVMALAAYGKALPIPFVSVDQGRLRVTDEAMEILARPKGTTGYAPEDLAASVQQAVEFAVAFRARQAQQLTGQTDLCLAGGVFLNCIANARLDEAGPVQNIFCPSAPSDDGIAIGAAFHGAYVSGDDPIEPTEYTPYLGTPTRLDHLTELAAGLGLTVSTMDNLPATAADLLWTEGVLLWHQGPSEFGPRALGNRSILANPFAAGMRDRINHHIKFRESFRPVAPILLASALERYFLGAPSRLTALMLESRQVRPEYSALLGEALHVDGSARVQTVADDAPLPVAAVLKAFGARSGHPVLINTSLNGKDEPICETPADTLRFFAQSPVRHAVIGDRLIGKQT